MDQTNYQNPMNPAPESGSSYGPIIGIIIILAVIVFGALYFAGDRGTDQAMDSQVNSIEAQSNSDEISDIEADLEATNVESVDAELNSN